MYIKCYRMGDAERPKCANGLLGSASALPACPVPPHKLELLLNALPVMSANVELLIDSAGYDTTAFAAASPLMADSICWYVTLFSSTSGMPLIDMSGTASGSGCIGEPAGNAESGMSKYDVHARESLSGSLRSDGFMGEGRDGARENDESASRRATPGDREEENAPFGASNDDDGTGKGVTRRRAGATGAGADAEGALRFNGNVGGVGLGAAGLTARCGGVCCFCCCGAVFFAGAAGAGFSVGVSARSIGASGLGVADGVSGALLVRGSAGVA